MVDSHWMRGWIKVETDLTGNRSKTVKCSKDGSVHSVQKLMENIYRHNH